MVVVELYFVEAHEPADAIYLSIYRFFGIPISRGIPESPVVYQRRDGDVERPSREGINILRLCPHGFEQCVRRCVAVVIDGRKNGVGIKHTQTRVKRLQCRFNAVLQVLCRLIADVVIRAENLPFVMVVGLLPIVFRLLALVVQSPNQQRCQAYTQQRSDSMFIIRPDHVLEPDTQTDDAVELLVI